VGTFRYLFYTIFLYQCHFLKCPRCAPMYISRLWFPPRKCECPSLCVEKEGNVGGHLETEGLSVIIMSSFLCLVALADSKKKKKKKKIGLILSPAQCRTRTEHILLF
jgi:hypothetical protein